MALKLPRAIRLDPSDTFVFEKAAEPGEWVVSGSFLFDGSEVANLPPKMRTAFRGGFLGTRTFGWTTLAVVTEATADDVEEAVASLASHLLSIGAPDEETARAAAREEVEFAASLCQPPPQTLIAVHRTAEGGSIRERFRTLTPRGDRPSHAPLAFQIFESDDAAEDGSEDNLRISDLLKPA